VRANIDRTADDFSEIPRLAYYGVPQPSKL